MNNRIPNLDLVRLFAALSVLVAHWFAHYHVSSADSQLRTLTAGLGEGLTRFIYGNHKINVGVLSFIVLSGFVIHLTARVQPGWRKSFLLHRTFRIVPLFLVAFGGGVLCFFI
jgi:peptidoglycan/LPS O-acetylase OafA/YrhL